MGVVFHTPPKLLMQQMDREDMLYYMAYFRDKPPMEEAAPHLFARLAFDNARHGMGGGKVNLKEFYTDFNPKEEPGNNRAELLKHSFATYAKAKGTYIEKG